MSEHPFFFTWTAQQGAKPLELTGGEGAWFTTKDGSRWLDLGALSYQVNVGHGNQRIVDAIKRQADELSFWEAVQPGDMLEGRQTTTQLLPWTLQVGVNVDITPNIEIGTELRYWLYRQYKKQHTDIVGIFLVHELETQKNYNDSWQVSGGIRVHDLPAAPHLELMAGTHYDRTPAPESTLTLDQPTFRHIGLHTGLRWTVGRYRIGASYLRYFYLVPTVNSSTTSPPTNFRGSGANHIFTVSIEASL